MGNDIVNLEREMMETQKIIEKAIVEHFNRTNAEQKHQKEESTMKVSYNGFEGVLIKLERKERDTKSPYDHVSPFNYDLSIQECYAEGKVVTHQFTGVHIADIQFLGGVVSFGE